MTGASSAVSSLRRQAADWLRASIPAGQRRKIAWTRLHLRIPTAGLRMLPDFLVIGAQRSGTSSLYRYLGGHPDVVPSLRKETEYFSFYHESGERWYRAHFPLMARREIHRFVVRRRLVTFEATPDYLLDPRAARRAAAFVPDAKIIVLLRDPVERAYSHHQHMTRLGYETLPFEAAIAEEEARIGQQRDRVAADEGFVSTDYLRFSYLERGRYAQQLHQWFDHFGRDRVLVIKSEDMYSNTVVSFGRILEFLGLDPWEPPSFQNHSYDAAKERPIPKEMASSTRSELEAYFAQMNSDLCVLLGHDIGWG